MKRPRKTTVRKNAGNVNPRTRKRAQKPAPVQAPSEGIGMFPTGILTNILSKLPVKSLLRFKSVSKWWCAHVSSPEFCQLHLQRSLQTSSNSSALVCQDYAAFFYVEMDQVENLDTTVSVKLDRSKAGGFQAGGSCNGLICLKAERDNAILYNPATQVRHDLPTVPGDHPDRVPANPVDPGDGYLIYTNVKFGFGYDSTCHDYKLWRICVFLADIDNCPFAVIAKVYSLKANRWTRVQNFPKNIEDIYSKSGVPCNETMHWVACLRTEGSYRTEIIGFELHGEKYSQLPGPNHGFDYCKMYLSLLDGCLCVTCKPSSSDSKVGISVWVMKEYGIQESWTKLFNIDRDELRPFISARTLAYSKTRDEVLIHLSYCGLLWYDLRNAKVKGYLSCKPTSAEVCLQTLVSPRTGSFHKNGELQTCAPPEEIRRYGYYDYSCYSSDDSW